MKLVLILAAAGLLMVCNIPVIPLDPTPQPTLTPTRAETIRLEGPTVARPFPDDGDLSSQLQAEAPKAAALGQHMFVEFDASW
jgi:hypothetical protein